MSGATKLQQVEDTLRQEMERARKRYEAEKACPLRRSEFKKALRRFNALIIDREVPSDLQEPKAARG
jgi:hypothetical protein